VFIKSCETKIIICSYDAAENGFVGLVIKEEDGWFGGFGVGV